VLRIGDLNGDKCRRRQLLLPSTQNAAIDTIPASDLSGTRSILRGLSEYLALIRLTEPAPMSLTWSRNDWAYRTGGGI